MSGKIDSRQKCPTCRTAHYVDEGPPNGLACASCGWRPTLFEVVIWWRGKALRITHDKRTGARFRTYVHTARALGKIRDEIEEKCFYPDDWKSAKANKLIWENFLAGYKEYETKRCEGSGRLATLRKKKILWKKLACFKGKNIKELRKGDIDDFAASPEVQKYAPKYQRNILEELRSVFYWALDRETISKVPRFPRITVPESVPAWLNRDQQQLVLAHIDPEHRPIFRFLMLYACRVSEACALMWDSVDLEKGVVWFARTFSDRKIIQTTKTKRARSQPIHDAFAADLATMARGIGETPVFRNPEARNPAGWYTADFLRNRWNDAVNKTGLSPVQLKNATRHSRATQAMNQEGWSESALQFLLGHTSANHIKKYAQPQLELLKALVDGPAAGLDKKGVVKELSRKNRSTKE